jgi:hypothetical protein
MDEYYDLQAKQVAAVLVKATLLPKEKELAAIGLLRESFRERFSFERVVSVVDDLVPKPAA